MAQIPTSEVELKDVLLSNSSFGPGEISFVAKRISNDYTQFPVLREVTQELENQINRSPASSVRLGVCQYLLGRYRDAIQTLENADGGAWRSSIRANHISRPEIIQRAIECYTAARTAGYDKDHVRTGHFRSQTTGIRSARRDGNS